MISVIQFYRIFSTSEYATEQDSMSSKEKVDIVEGIYLNWLLCCDGLSFPVIQEFCFEMISI
jgi:NADH:ubiquinone oxidoreductase subunit 4 (subunit M)